MEHGAPGYHHHRRRQRNPPVRSGETGGGPRRPLLWHRLHPLSGPRCACDEGGQNKLITMFIVAYFVCFNSSCNIGVVDPGEERLCFCDNFVCKAVQEGAYYCGFVLLF